MSLLTKKTVNFQGQPGTYRVRVVTRDSQVAASTPQKSVGISATDTSPTSNFFRVTCVSDAGRRGFFLVHKALSFQGSLNTEYWFRMRAVARDGTSSDWLYSEPIVTAAVSAPPGTSNQVPKLSAAITDLMKFYLFLGAEETLADLAAQLADAVKNKFADASKHDASLTELEKLDALAEEIVDFLPQLFKKTVEETSPARLVEYLVTWFVLYPEVASAAPGFADEAASVLEAVFADRLAESIGDEVLVRLFGDPEQVFQSEDYRLAFFGELRETVVETAVFSGLLQRFFEYVSPLLSYSLMEPASFGLRELVEYFETARSEVREILGTKPEEITRLLAGFNVFELLLVSVALGTLGKQLDVLREEAIRRPSAQAGVAAVLDDGSAYLSDDVRWDLDVEASLEAFLNLSLAGKLRQAFIDSRWYSWLVEFRDAFAVGLSELLPLVADMHPSVGKEEFLGARAGEFGRLGVDYFASSGCALDGSDLVERFDFDRWDAPVVLRFSEISVEGATGDAYGLKRNAFIMGFFILGEAIMGE